jgi:methyl-accepting chemotaxis protein
VITLRIKTKLLLLLTFVFVVMTALVVAMYVKTSNVTMNIADTEAAGTVQDIAKVVDAYFTGLGNIVNNARPGVLALFDEEGSVDRSRLDALMLDLTKANSDEHVANIYVGLAVDGSLHIGSDYVPAPDYDSRKRPWYTEAVASGKVALTEPYVDSDTGGLIISTSVPLYGASKELLGVLAADVFLETLAANVRDARVLGSGFGMLLTSDGLVLEHEERGFVTKENFSKVSSNVTPELAAIGAKLKAGETGWGDYTMRGTPQRIYYTTGKSGYVAAIVFPHSQLDAVVRSVTMVQIIAGAIALILVVTYIFLTIPGITKPLSVVQESLEHMASFDLAADAAVIGMESALREGTELGMMIKSLRHVRGAFNGVVLRVRGDVDRMASSATELDGLSRSVNEKMTGAGSSAANVTELAKNVLRRIDSAAGAVREVAQSSATAAASATEGAEASRETSKLSGEVSRMVNDFVEELQSVERTSSENSRNITELGSSVASITDFVVTIGNIAKQTNLLALNAAIEAARAGDAGRGFAVVAEEVRSLADESDKAARKVAEMIERLESGANAAMISTQSTTDVISDVISKALEAQQRLQKTLTEEEKVNEAVESIAATAQEQAASSQEISDSTEQIRADIGDVTQEISAVTNSAQETARAVQKISDEAARLSSLSAELKEILANFKTEQRSEISRRG